MSSPPLVKRMKQQAISQRIDSEPLAAHGLNASVNSQLLVSGHTTMEDDYNVVYLCNF